VDCHPFVTASNRLKDFWPSPSANTTSAASEEPADGADSCFGELMIPLSVDHGDVAAFAW
jgi:hypothetical protein